MFSFTTMTWRYSFNRLAFYFPIVKVRNYQSFNQANVDIPSHTSLMKRNRIKHLQIGAILVSSILLTSCFQLFGEAKPLLPIDAVLNESGKPVFYVDKFSIIKRYGIRGVLITKDNATACDLIQKKHSEPETIWGYEMSTPIEKGVELNQQNLEELPKEVAYGVIPPKVNQDVTQLEKNTVYHANLSIVVSRHSEVYSFRKGGLVFIINDNDELISKDLNAMCNLEKSLAEKKKRATEHSIAQN